MIRRRVLAVLGAIGLALAVAVAPAQAAPNVDAPGWTWEVRSDGVRYSSPYGTFTVTHAFGFVPEHARLGGGRGQLGYPTAPVRTETWTDAVTGTQRSGRYQTFERGVVYSSDLGTFAVKGGPSPFARTHAANGGGGGALGYPVGPERQQASGYWFQEFAVGVIYSGPRGTYAVTAERPWNTTEQSTAARVHRALGGGGGKLGYPTGNRVWQTGQHFQTFERGIVYCGAKIPAWPELHCAAVTGGFLAVHAAQGGGTGATLGYPVNNEKLIDIDCSAAIDMRWVQSFAYGQVFITPGTGAVQITHHGGGGC